MESLLKLIKLLDIRSIYKNQQYIYIPATNNWKIKLSKDIYNCFKNKKILTNKYNRRCVITVHIKLQKIQRI